jgi:uncharacterized membrane protein
MLPIEHIHPMVVHFPIVFAVTLAGFDLVAAFLGRDTGGRGPVGNVSAGLAVLAALAAMAASTFGDMALEIALAKGGPADALEFHDMLGTISATLLSVWGALRVLAWWRRIPLAGARAWGAAFVETAIVAVVLVTAFYGGNLVYGHGVAVAMP